MSGQSGYPLQQGPKFCKDGGGFITVQRAGLDKNGQDVLPKSGFITLETTISAVTYDSLLALWTITIAGHGAKRHNFIRFVDGSEEGNETPIYDIPTVNTIRLYGAPHLSDVQVGDTVQILRYVTPTVDVDGAMAVSIPVAPSQFILNGASQQVIEDTGTPADSRPLPVKLMNADGTTFDTTLFQQLVNNQYLSIRSFANLDFAVFNVTNAAWVELKADVGATAIKKAQIFMSGGEPLEIAFGAAAAEVSQGYILPGGNGYVDLEMPANTRVSVRAVNAVTVNVGNLITNFLG